VLIRKIALPVFVLFLISSCAAQTSLAFTLGDGTNLRTRRSVEQSEDGVERVSYRLERPVSVLGGENAVFLGFSQRLSSARFSLSYLGNVISETKLAIVEGIGNNEFRYPLAAGARFDALSITYPPSADENPELTRAGIAGKTGGIDLADGIVVDTRLSGTIATGNPHSLYTFDVSGITAQTEGAVRVRIAYEYTGQPTRTRSVIITAQASGDTAVFGLRPKIGQNEVYLYEGMCGFVPITVEIAAESTGFALVSLHVSGVAQLDRSEDIPAPIPVDMGGLVGSGSDSWRRDDYELYSWNLYPDILIMDTVSYAVQSEFFKRLAFFVEKAGTAGSLVPDSQLAKRHGWNAHDYRAEDLARFFSRARLEAFSLGDREQHLLDILLRTGIVTEAGDSFLPGVGGLIALSQESEPRLRSLFMVHEGYHGVFFLDARYQAAVRSVWEELSGLEQQFWKEFLLLRNYNVADEYLVINEFQAYLMQVTADRLDAYYWNYAVPGLAKAVPRTGRLVEELMELYPDTFMQSAARVERALREFAGIGAEDLFCMVRTKQ
jgi:hypothetical protein